MLLISMPEPLLREAGDIGQLSWRESSTLGEESGFDDGLGIGICGQDDPGSCVHPREPIIPPSEKPKKGSKDSNNPNIRIDRVVIRKTNSMRRCRQKLFTKSTVPLLLSEIYSKHKAATRQYAVECFISSNPSSTRCPRSPHLFRVGRNWAVACDKYIKY